MQTMESLSKEAFDRYVENALRQFQAGLNRSQITSNIEDLAVETDCAKQIVEVAHIRYIEQVNKTPKSNPYRDLTIIDIMPSIYGGLGYAIAGGLVLSVFAMMTHLEFSFLDCFIGFAAGVGTYERAIKRHLFLYRIIAGGASLIGILFGKLIYFSFLQVFKKAENMNTLFESLINNFTLSNVIWLLAAITIAMVVVPRNYSDNNIERPTTIR